MIGVGVVAVPKSAVTPGTCESKIESSVAFAYPVL